MGMSGRAAVGLADMTMAANKKAEQGPKQMEAPKTEQQPAPNEAPKVRMYLNLDITAPLVLLPSASTETVKNSFLMLDLGHILITHDSGPIEEPSERQTFLIKLDRIGAYVQTTNDSPVPSMALIKPFSIGLDISTGTKSPTTLLRGKLDKFKICVTKEKLRDLIQVVSSIQPPPPMKEIAPADEPEVPKLGQVSEPEKKASGEKEVSFSAIFELSVFCVSVRDTGANKPTGGQPLLKTKIKDLKADVEVSNWETKAGLTLDWHVFLRVL